jgi:N6-L-threonylcarbamoyladenine synthase
MKILGIETSCDETAAAIVSSEREVLSNIVYSQIEEHAAYGGVVPEIASRAHIKYLDEVILESLRVANCSWSDIDAIAVTAGPGLIGGVIVGVMEAKAIASALKKPIIAVNHLEGHSLTVRLTNDVKFPYLLLLVSGGHCQILLVRGVGDYELLGETLDDAVGESFDKLAKVLGLAQPGGPKIEQLALNGNPDAFKLPRPLWGDGTCNFSFSGLKTAVKRIVETGGYSNEDICAVFQKTVADILCERLKNAIFQLKTPVTDLVIAGGVAANQYIKAQLTKRCAPLNIVSPPIKLCTDNAAMIAWAGLEKFRLGQTASLDFVPKARWPLAAS